MDLNSGKIQKNIWVGIRLAAVSFMPEIFLL